MKITKIASVNGENISIRIGNTILDLAAIKLGNKYALVETSGADTDYPVIFVKTWTKEAIRKALPEMSLFGYTVDEPAANSEELDEIAAYLFNLVSLMTNQEAIEYVEAEAAKQIGKPIHEMNEDEKDAVSVVMKSFGWDCFLIGKIEAFDECEQHVFFYVEWGNGNQSDNIQDYNEALELYEKKLVTVQ